MFWKVELGGHLPAPGLCWLNRGQRTEALKLKGLQAELAGRYLPPSCILTEYLNSFCYCNGSYTQTWQKLLPQSCLGEGPESTPSSPPPPSSLLPLSHRAVGGMKVTVLGQLRIPGARSSEMVWWLRMLATKADHLSFDPPHLSLAPTWWRDRTNSHGLSSNFHTRTLTF